MKIKFGLTKVLIPIIVVYLIALGGCKNNNANHDNMSSTATTNANNKDTSSDDSIIKKYGNLYGFVKSANNDIFSVDKQKMIKQNNGITSADSGEIVKFKCNDRTKILIRNTYNNGAKYKDTNGSLNDIKTDRLVSVWGKEQSGGTIMAETVVVFKFN
jgi:hypothetical protein